MDASSYTRFLRNTSKKIPSKAWVLVVELLLDFRVKFLCSAPETS